MVEANCRQVLKARVNMKPSLTIVCRQLLLLVVLLLTQDSTRLANGQLDAVNAMLSVVPVTSILATAGLVGVKLAALSRLLKMLGYNQAYLANGGSGTAAHPIGLQTHYAYMFPYVPGLNVSVRGEHSTNYQNLAAQQREPAGRKTFPSMMVPGDYEIQSRPFRGSETLKDIFKQAGIKVHFPQTKQQQLQQQVQQQPMTGNLGLLPKGNNGPLEKLIAQPMIQPDHQIINIQPTLTGPASDNFVVANNSPRPPYTSTQTNYFVQQSGSSSIQSVNGPPPSSSAALSLPLSPPPSQQLPQPPHENHHPHLQPQQPHHLYHHHQQQQQPTESHSPPLAPPANPVDGENKSNNMGPNSGATQTLAENGDLGRLQQSSSRFQPEQPDRLSPPAQQMAPASGGDQQGPPWTPTSDQSSQQMRKPDQSSQVIISHHPFSPKGPSTPISMQFDSPSGLAFPPASSPATLAAPGSPSLAAAATTLPAPAPLPGAPEPPTFVGGPDQRPRLAPADVEAQLSAAGQSSAPPPLHPLPPPYSLSPAPIQSGPDNQARPASTATPPHRLYASMGYSRWEEFHPIPQHEYYRAQVAMAKLRRPEGGPGDRLPSGPLIKPHGQGPNAFEPFDNDDEPFATSSQPLEPANGRPLVQPESDIQANWSGEHNNFAGIGPTMAANSENHNPNSNSNSNNSSNNNNNNNNNNGPTENELSTNLVPSSIANDTPFYTGELEHNEFNFADRRRRRRRRRKRRSPEPIEFEGKQQQPKIAANSLLGKIYPPLLEQQIAQQALSAGTTDPPKSLQNYGMPVRNINEMRKRSLMAKLM